MEIEKIVRGRGFILYAMSLMAWSIEIGGLYIHNGINHSGDTGNVISDYLEAALMGSSCSEMSKFICISVIFLVVLFLVINVLGMISRKKDTK